MRNRREFICDLFVGALLFPSSAEGASFTLPDISVYTEQGKQTKLNAYYGNPLLLNVWARYCGPCIEEIPEINHLAASISVLGLYFMDSTSFSENSSALQRVKRDRPMRFPNVLVSLDASTQLSNAYARQTGEPYISLPTFFVLDSSGNCVHRQSGSLKQRGNYTRLQQRVRSVR